MKAIIDYYDNNDEDFRISTNKARKIEFIISTSILDEHIKPDDKILDQLQELVYIHCIMQRTDMRY